MTQLDGRLFAITLARMWSERRDKDELNEVAAEALRTVGVPGVVSGLTDLSAALMESVALHHEIELAELADMLRLRAIEENE